MAYTTIDDPSAYFQIALYTGNGTGQTITNDGNSDLQPDFLWFKNRDETVANILWDSSRGITKFLISEQTAADQTNPATYELTSFNTDGFGLGIHNTAGINQSAAYTYVCWQWKANGGTTTSVSESGTGANCINASTHQVNTDAGFSIITYTGRADEITVHQQTNLTHGLGVAPDFTIMKKRDGTGNWVIMGKYVTTSSAYSANEHLTFGTAAVSDAEYTGYIAPTSTYIYLGDALVNDTDDDYICYAFASKQGYSKFGSFVGNGNANGPFVYLGFKPAFIMMKNISIAGSWRIIDAKRNPGNLVNKQLSPSGNGAESTSPAYIASDFLSNGFKLRTSEAEGNGSGDTYIYMAFAENPFTTSTGIPATAR
jgi:hypothetical protein